MAPTKKPAKKSAAKQQPAAKPAAKKAKQMPAPAAPAAFQEAPDEVIPVHDASGAPAAAFVSCSAAGARKPSAAAAAAAADPVNAAALGAPRLMVNAAERELNGDHAVKALADFKRGFDEITAGTFDALSASDRANVVVAGGVVVSALHCEPGAASPNSDADVFIHGLDEVAARAKVEALFAAFKAASPDAVALRTPHTLTVVLPYPKKLVQIILNLHATAAEAVHAFDVDVCGCYYDFDRVYATRRAARALATRVNVAAPRRRSATFESRLLKYAKRGYEIAVPVKREFV